MFPTGVLPLSPFLNLAGIVTLAGWIGLGLCVALVAGFAVQRRDADGGPAIALADTDSATAEQSPHARFNG
jgi:hypothetical protein